MMIKIPRPAWHIAALLPTAFFLYQKLARKKRHDSPRSDWWAIGFSLEQLIPRIQAFIDGNYLFSPMRQFQFENETIRIWQYDDRIILRCLFTLLKPTFPHILSKVCYHLKGPHGVKLALRHIENALTARSFQYTIRLDIKDYYASISHSILIQQCQQHFHDPKVLHYLTHIIANAVDDGGNVFLPRQGIPRRSCFSPFFGALYLLPLDRAFEHRHGCLYLRFMDDGAPRTLTKSVERFSWRCCAEDESRPLEVGIQVQTSNHLKLRYLRGIVVSVKEKAGRDSVRYILKR